MSRITLYKKIKMFNEFRKILKLNKIEIEQTFGSRIDKAYRIYNVINVPKEYIGEAYDLKKSDIDRISESYLKEYASIIGKFLDSRGLKEMYDFYDIKKVDKYSYLIIIGFSLPNNPFRSNIYYTRLKYTYIILSFLLLIYSLILIF